MKSEDYFVLQEIESLSLPVAHTKPPTIARGQNRGQFWIKLTTKETIHMEAQRIHWKNMPMEKSNAHNRELVEYCMCECLNILSFR